MLEHCSPEQENKLYISQAALVEVVATMCRKTREQKITVAQRDNLIEIFRQDSLLIFVCDDLGLLEVAVAEGLSIENPNNYT